MTTYTSRYYISSTDLVSAARALQIGSGISDRLTTVDATQFIVEGEDWAEDKVEEFIGVPLSPVRARGQAIADFDINSLTKRNFPHSFVEAATYRALGLILASEYFENAPNASTASEWALDAAEEFIYNFKESKAFRTGAGRRRHPNPMVPPHMGPRVEQEPQQ